MGVGVCVCVYGEVVCGGSMGVVRVCECVCYVGVWGGECVCGGMLRVSNVAPQPYPSAPGGLGGTFMPSPTSGFLALEPFYGLVFHTPT